MSYSNGLLSDQSYQTANKYVQRGLPGVGFKLTDTGDYDMQNKKLVNVKNGVNGSDAVTKSQLDTKTSLLDGARTNGYIVNNKAVVYSQTGAVHAKSFYLQDQNEDEVRILTDNQDFDNVHLFVPNLKNFDGFGGRKRSEIMVTSVDQIISGNKFFQNIKAPNPSEDGDVANKNYVDFEITKQNVLIDNEFVKKSGSLMTGDLILPHYNYPVQGNTNKAISYETQREIFISRKETFPMERSLDMNNNVIENIAEATSDHQALRKSQLDNALVNVNNDLSDKADKSYVDTEITKVHQNLDLAPFLKKDGQRSMTGDLNMDNNNIIILKDPVNDADDVNKKFFEDKLLESHLLPSHHENAFKYLLDQDESSSERRIRVNGIVDFNGSPHKNKKAYDIDLLYIPGTQNYDSQIGINIYPLAIGKYTIIMEYYFPEDTGISLSCTTSTAVIAKQTTKKFSDYMKLLVQFDQQTKDTPDYLYFDIRGSASTSTNPEGYLVFYGMKDWFDIVNPSIYDHALESSMFEYNNGNIKMNNVIDMDNHKIKNLSDGTDANDAVNKGQIDAIITRLNKLDKLDKNYIYRQIFGENFYDLLDLNYLKLVMRNNRLNIDGSLPHLYLGTNVIINNYDVNHGLILSPRSYIIIPFMSFNLRHFTTPIYDSYTFFMSFNHNTNARGDISLVDNNFDQQFPHFMLAGNEIIIEHGPTVKKFPIPSVFRSHKIFIWICFDGTNRTIKIKVSNDQNPFYFSIPGTLPYYGNKLEIKYNSFINKIGFANRFIDLNSLEAQEITLAEKKNGSYLS